jgi:hypothetical protein
MLVAELIYEKVKTLPANRMAEILDFVEFIRQRETRNDGSTTAADAKEDATDDSWFERGEECPICAAHRDPVTGNPLYKPEIYESMREVDDMLSGKIPSTLKWHTSLDDLDEMLGL